jgi:hypothetical protein
MGACVLSDFLDQLIVSLTPDPVKVNYLVTMSLHKLPPHFSFVFVPSFKNQSALFVWKLENVNVLWNLLRYLDSIFYPQAFSKRAKSPSIFASNGKGITA